MLYKYMHTQQLIISVHAMGGSKKKYIEFASVGKYDRCEVHDVHYTRLLFIYIQYFGV